MPKRKFKLGDKVRIAENAQWAFDLYGDSDNYYEESMREQLGSIGFVVGYASDGCSIKGSVSYRAYRVNCPDGDDLWWWPEIALKKVT